MLEKIIDGLSLFIGVLIFVLIIGLIISWPFMLLWNGCLVGLITGIGPITSIWQAWGILILVALLFKRSQSSIK
jgi:hypothetical protein